MQHQNIFSRTQMADKLNVQDSYKSYRVMLQNNISLDAVLDAFCI